MKRSKYCVYYGKGEVYKPNKDKKRGQFWKDDYILVERSFVVISYLCGDILNFVHIRKTVSDDIELSIGCTSIKLTLDDLNDSLLRHYEPNSKPTTEYKKVICVLYDGTKIYSPDWDKIEQDFHSDKINWEAIKDYLR